MHRKMKEVTKIYYYGMSLISEDLKENDSENELLLEALLLEGRILLLFDSKFRAEDFLRGPLVMRPL